MLNYDKTIATRNELLQFVTIRVSFLTFPSNQTSQTGIVNLFGWIV